MRLHNVGTRTSTAAAWDSLGFEVVEQVRVLRLENVDGPTAISMHADTSMLPPRPGPPSSPEGGLHP
jgi:hypothetical protein